MEEPLLPDDNDDVFQNHEGDIHNLQDTELFFPLHRLDLQIGDFTGAIRTLKLMLAFWVMWLVFVVYNLCTQGIRYKDALDIYITFEYWFEVCTVTWIPLSTSSIYAYAQALSKPILLLDIKW